MSVLALNCVILYYLIRNLAKAFLKKSFRENVNIDPALISEQTIGFVLPNGNKKQLLHHITVWSVSIIHIIHRMSTVRLPYHLFGPKHIIFS